MRIPEAPWTSDRLRLLCVQAVYTALKETESRATDVVPLWKLPFLAPLIPRQRKALDSVALIRRTTEELIAKCKALVDCRGAGAYPLMVPPTHPLQSVIPVYHCPPPPPPPPSSRSHMQNWWPFLQDGLYPSSPSGHAALSTLSPPNFR